MALSFCLNGKKALKIDNISQYMKMNYFSPDKLLTMHAPHKLSFQYCSTQIYK